MKFKEIIMNMKDSIKDKNDKFKNLSKQKKIAIIVGLISVAVATGFGIKYAQDNKYGVLFSGLNATDAATVTQALETEGIDTKIEGDSICVPKEQVDKLRLKLSANITQGSKGFELMDEGSSFGLTDEEFAIKKQRMVQGEIEKTIKTFPQVEDARVHITEGEDSVFATESVPGSAAVSITLKTGQKLETSQIRSIMSLVSASSTNIPKQNVEVVDQNMNLLSDGVFDEEGNEISTNSNGLDIARRAEKELSSDLQKSVIGLLEPIFGEGKVKVTVNADLNFDTQEISETTLNQKPVVMKESKSENTTTEETGTGGAVDNNMNNVGKEESNTTTGSKEETREYDTGRVETKTIKAQGELNKVTAAVAIDGNLTPVQINNISDMVANTIGIDNERGDSIKVVAMNFGVKEEVVEEEGMSNTLKIVGIVAAVFVLAGIGILVTMIILKKKKGNEEEEYNDEYEIELINQKLEEMDKNSQSEEEGDTGITLEEEVRNYASENPDKVTDLINNWLNV